MKSPKRQYFRVFKNPHATWRPYEIHVKSRTNGELRALHGNTFHTLAEANFVCKLLRKPSPKTPKLKANKAA